MNLLDIENSLLKYLYENLTIKLVGEVGLEAPLDIKVFESVNQVNFDTFNKWVVIDTLTNRTGDQPKQILFLHIATKKGLKNEKKELLSLIDTVMAVVNSGTRFECYATDGITKIGEIEVCETSLSPILQHPGGGAFRSLTVELVY